MRLRALLAISVLSLFVLVLVYDMYERPLQISGIQDRTSKNPDYTIFIEIEDKTLYLLADGLCVDRYPISSGRSGQPSPLGYWKITDKGNWGEGFGGSWMGLDVPWGIYGIHGTVFPESIGSGASQGCIRMFTDDAAQLYETVPVGTRVVIVNGPFGPFGRGFDEIDVGDRGADVMAIQARLKELGFYEGEVDGIYQDGTKRALHEFQKACGLRQKNRITSSDFNAMGFKIFE